MAMEKFGRWLDPGVFKIAHLRRHCEIAHGRQCPNGVAIGVAGFIVSFDLFTSVGEAR
jgi:hypothetical protein